MNFFQMRRDFLSKTLIVSVVLLFVFSLCLYEDKPAYDKVMVYEVVDRELMNSTEGKQQPKLIASMEIITPKDTYRSGERIDFQIRVNSSSNISDAEVVLYGIYVGGYRLNKSEKITLNKGLNTLSFRYTMPPCSRCAGISPGRYNITAKVLCEGQIIAETFSYINLRQ